MKPFTRHWEMLQLAVLLFTICGSIKDVCANSFIILKLYNLKLL